MKADSLRRRASRPWGAALFALMLPLLVLPGAVHTTETVFLDEHFESLARWQPLTFPKIQRHSTYTVARCETTNCLLMESNNSASALVLKQPFNVYDYPLLTWRWKVSNVYRKGDSGTKEGDDYPARLYVMFVYDPDRASLAKKLRYKLAKTVYGQYPPDSSISYIWDNQATGKPFIINAYVDEARMIPVSAGVSMVNTWQEYTVDIVRDYRMAFGEDPPAMASLAVMNDSDNTHEAARSWVEYIRISRSP
jgi:hypothetical protein